MAEMMTVIVIFALFSTFVVAIVGPLMAAPHQQQAKIDTLQTAVQGLYRLQRDLRMSDAYGVWVCTGTTMPACSQPPTLTPADEVVVISPLSTAQLTWNTSGAVLWQGFNVYWLVPNDSASNDLKEAFVGAGCLGLGNPLAGAGASSLSQISPALLPVCIGNATASSSATVVAHNVYQLQLSVDAANSVVGLKMMAQSTVGGRTNRTSYESDIYTRN